MMPDRKRLYSADSDDSHVKEAQEQRDIINKEASQIDKKCDALEKNRYNEQRVSDWNIKKIEYEIENLKRESFEIDLKFQEYDDSSDISAMGAASNKEHLEMTEETLLQRIAEESEKLEETHREINHIKDKIDTITSKIKKIPTDESSSDSSVQSNKTKLHLSKEKCSKLRSQNADMRLKIKSLRDEYRILSDNLKHIDTKLLNKQRLFSKMCHDTAQCQEERQENANRIRALNERGKKILNSLDNEEKSLSRAISNEIKLRQYLDDKFSDRVDSMDLGGADFLPKKTSNNSSHTRVDSPSAKKAMSDYETFMSKVDSRESMRLVKGRDRLPTVIDRHLSKEKVSFSRFNQINRLNSKLKSCTTKLSPSSWRMNKT